MNNHEVVVAVTGGNRGIGYEICQQLAQRGAQVVLTARSAKAGQAALEKLGAKSKNVSFHPLDVTSTESIISLRDFIERTFARLDVLINNAGILPDDDRSGLKVGLATIRTTLETNSLAPLHLSQVLAPLLKRTRGGRIVNMSSGLGTLSEMGADHAAYRISKAGLNAVTGILSAELQADGIAVNSMCPGWVRTDMGGPNAQRSVAEGADTAVWLALDAPQDLTGKFLRDRKVIPW
jgi:NAD(P)-dependent dehydrogenase (short-subunit alcohol dehydrogenase family)